MPAVAQAHHRDARLCGLRDAELACEFADDLPEATVAVDDRDRVALENDRRRLIGFHPPRAHPFQIFADAQNAVRIVADEVGIDEPPRDRRGFDTVAPRRMHDCGHQLNELGRVGLFHVCRRALRMVGDGPLGERVLAGNRVDRRKRARDGGGFLDGVPEMLGDVDLGQPDLLPLTNRYPRTALLER